MSVQLPHGHWSQHMLFTLCHFDRTIFITQNQSSLLPTCFTSSLEPAPYITQNSSSKLFIPLSATFIWTCRFNLLHTAITFHHFFTVSLWALNFPFQKNLFLQLFHCSLLDWSHGFSTFVLDFLLISFYGYVLQTKLPAQWLVFCHMLCILVFDVIWYVRMSVPFTSTTWMICWHTSCGQLFCGMVSQFVATFISLFSEEFERSSHELTSPRIDWLRIDLSTLSSCLTSHSLNTAARPSPFLVNKTV